LPHNPQITGGKKQSDEGAAFFDLPPYIPLGEMPGEAGWLAIFALYILLSPGELLF